MSDPRLQLPEIPQDAGPGGTHALLIGLSDYPFLIDGTIPADKGPNAFGMKSLTSPALSAYFISRWLRKASSDGLLSKPLASCRLILAPSPVEAALIAKLEREPINLDPLNGRYDSIAQAINDWRDDAASRPENVSWFYYAGHGVQLGNPLLLANGYNQKGKPPLDEAIEFTELTDGMKITKDFPDMARTQFYMLDACRSDVARKLSSARPRQFWVKLADSTETNDRGCATIYATRSNSPAFGQHLRPTPFARALVRSLRNHAADAEAPTGQDKHWVVRNYRLGQVMNQVVPAYAKSFAGTRQQVECVFASDALWTTLKKPPRVNVNIELAPATAHPPVSFQLVETTSGASRAIQDPKHPYLVKLTPGRYEGQLSFPPTANLANVTGAGHDVVRPPEDRWVIPCASKA